MSIFANFFDNLSFVFAKLELIIPQEEIIIGNLWKLETSQSSPMLTMERQPWSTG